VVRLIYVFQESGNLLSQSLVAGSNTQICSMEYKSPQYILRKILMNLASEISSNKIRYGTCPSPMMRIWELFLEFPPPFFFVLIINSIALKSVDCRVALAADPTMEWTR
jgi:hypothetical protein